MTIGGYTIVGTIKFPALILQQQKTANIILFWGPWVNLVLIQHELFLHFFW